MLLIRDVRPVSDPTVVHVDFPAELGGGGNRQVPDHFLFVRGEGTQSTLVPEVLHPQECQFSIAAELTPLYAVDHSAQVHNLPQNQLVEDEEKCKSNFFYRYLKSFVGLQFYHRLTQTKVIISPHGVTPLAASIYDKEHALFQSYFQCLVEQLTFIFNHPAGTCNRRQVSIDAEHEEMNISP